MGMGDIRLQPGALPSGRLWGFLLCWITGIASVKACIRWTLWRSSRELCSWCEAVSDLAGMCGCQRAACLPRCTCPPVRLSLVKVKRKKSSVSETTFSVIQLIRFNLWNVTVNGESLELYGCPPAHGCLLLFISPEEQESAVGPTAVLCY